MKLVFSKFDVSVDFKEADFAVAPTDYQRNWTLRRALLEFRDDLLHLNSQMNKFVKGAERPEIDENWKSSVAAVNEAELIIQGQQVMQAWEHPLMKALAEAAGHSHGDVLEVGFGMGISASYLQEIGLRSYTVIECNEQVIEQFEKWKKNYPDQDIRLVKGMWQEAVDHLDTYDGILFDTYPLSEEEVDQEEGMAYTHCGKFFPVAAKLLKKGGVFTYYSNEIDTLSRGHQRLLLEYFDSFEVSLVRGLEPPAGCQYWWSGSMVVVKAYKH